MTKSIIRGRSGAIIDVNGNVTIKYAALHAPDEVRRRIVAQGYLMLDAQARGVTVYPDVYQVFDYGYTMETLWPATFKSPEQVQWAMRDILRLLKTQIWRQPRLVLAGDSLGMFHQDYISQRAYRCAPKHLERIVTALEKVRQMDLTVTNHIHGDPTLANVMTRVDNSPVLTDPLPPSAYIPNFTVVDRAKMLQSAFGYERLLDPTFVDLSDMRIAPVIMDGASAEEVYATWYFLAVHIIRLMPYHEAKLWPVFLSWLDKIPL